MNPNKIYRMTQGQSSQKTPIGNGVDSVVKDSWRDKRRNSIDGGIGVMPWTLAEKLYALHSKGELDCVVHWSNWKTTLGFGISFPLTSMGTRRSSSRWGRAFLRDSSVLMMLHPRPTEHITNKPKGLIRRLQQGSVFWGHSNISGKQGTIQTCPRLLVSYIIH
jgi:hypothetical protein